ncbi:MAG: hypothetical protein ACE366_09510 [Bradymonadia bacterium]
MIRGTSPMAQLARRLGWPGALMVLAVALLGWQGGGVGQLQWTSGEGDGVADGAEVPVDATGRFEASDGPGGRGHIVQTLALPGPDGVLSMRMPLDRAQGRGITLPDSEVKVAYTEYTSDGSLHFKASRVVSGFVRLSGDVAFDNYLALSYDLEVEGEDRTWRRLEVDRINMRPAVRDASGDVPGASADASVWDGCTTWWADDDSEEFAEEDSGCGGDDLSEGYEESEPETSGCAGDDLDESSASDSGGGADCESCDGDAVASVSGRRRRSPLVTRLARWLPWLSIFVAIHLMRTPGRRRRRLWRRSR